MIFAFPSNVITLYSDDLMEAMIRISIGGALGLASSPVDRSLGLIKLQFPSPTFLELGAR
jgi:hypothetical protein